MFYAMTLWIFTKFSGEKYFIRSKFFNEKTLFFLWQATNGFKLWHFRLIITFFKICLFFFIIIIFSYLCMVEKALFLGQIFEMEILMDLHVTRTRESKNHIFSFGVCICMCVRVSVINIIKKQITAKTSNLVIYICFMYRCYLKLFIKIGRKLCVQGHIKKF